jgi:hypothetical protein
MQAACGGLTVLLAAPAPALAQNVIQFSLGASTFTRYQVKDDGTGLRTLPFPQVSSENRINATTGSNYWNGSQYVGRQYLYVQPDRSGRPAGVLMAWSAATGQSKAVTNFQSPFGVYFGRSLGSNDGLESFISFVLMNESTAQVRLYRAHVSAADIADASYQPITLNDSRLELVQLGSTNPAFYWWKHDGSGFYYLDSPLTKVRLTIVGVPDQLAYTAPVGLSELRVIPPVDPSNPDRYPVASVPAYQGVGNGILAIDLATASSWWLDTQATWTVSGIRGPCFSPDGRTIAYGKTRYDSKKTPYYGVYTVPFMGGAISRVTEVMGSTKSSLFLTVNNRDTP